MAWREIATADGVWHVDPAAEKRDRAKEWQLMFSFRPVSGEARPPRFWAPYPLESESRSALYAQAESVSDDELRALATRWAARRGAGDP